MEGWSNICKSMNVIYSINKVKENLYDHFNRYRKSSDIYSTYFHVKSLGIDGMQLNIIKVIGDKLTANIILKGKKLKVFFFPLK